MSYAVEACPSCKHPYSGHTSDGCWHHDAGVICECRMIPPPGTRKAASYPQSMFEMSMKLMDQNQELTRKVTELEEKLRVQTERAERLDKENDARFTKETEYQNRIRALEQRLRDVASYAARDLPQR